MMHESKESKGLTFFLNESTSPTYYNLSNHLQAQGWSRALSTDVANVREAHFHFHEEAAQCLEFKHLLADLVTKHCPGIMPLTYCINDHNWPNIVNKIAQVAPITWILKPSLLNNGQHIKIIQTTDELITHFLNPNRLGGEHVLQQYITKPHLLKGPKEGHKYSIRMFVVLTNYAGAYLYPKGYFNIGLNPYHDGEYHDIRPHLTNEHLYEDTLNVVQIPSDQYELFKPFYPQIQTIVLKVMQAIFKHVPQAFNQQNNPQLALFGFDFIVDCNLRVWLLEANHAPCFPTRSDHPLQTRLYYDFWQALIADFIKPIATKNLAAKARHFDLVLSISKL